jgi:hypothetical protein
MPRATKRRQEIRRPKRTGVPLTVYLNPELSAALAAASDRRKVDKSTLVRTAIERLLAELESGQLDLPLGL